MCVSKSTAEDVQSAFAVRTDRCAIVASPLRPSLHNLLPGPETVRDIGTVLHVGNNSFYKNRIQVLRIFARLEPTVATRLIMVGSAPSEDLRAMSNALGIESRTLWCNDTDDQTLASWYRRASVLVFPSLYEGYGWPVLEAMAFGLPAVCSNRGSLPEVAGDVARVVPLEREDEFVAAVAQILGDPTLAASMGERGRQRAALFDAKSFALQMQSIYLRAVGRAEDIQSA